MKQNGKLCSVSLCGAGHSGSTLLGMILGGHSSAFYMGEGGKVRYLHDERKPLRKRVCKICGEHCPVWSGFHWDETCALYPQLAAHVGASLIVDTTKDERWIEARSEEMRSAGGTSVLLFLTRDGRAVVNSRIRKYPERDPADQIQQWADKIATSEALFAGFDGPKTRVRYEELASDPEAVTRRICDLVGIPFEDQMLRFDEHPQHVLGGNSGTQFLVARNQFENPEDAFVSLGERTREYYGDHAGGIRLDLRWKQELSSEHAALFEKLAGRANAEMKWEA